jgi:hypothetical protein
MHFDIGLGTTGVLMGGGCIRQNTHDFFLGQYLRVIQRKKQSLANSKRGHS